MKKLLILITLLFSATASAQYMHWQSRYTPYYSGGGSGWIAPVIIGGVIGYSINRAQQPNTIIIQQSQPSVTVENNMECSAWRETQQPDGTIKRERICYQR
jgi:hypothetical protein